MRNFMERAKHRLGVVLAVCLGLLGFSVSAEDPAPLVSVVDGVVTFNPEIIVSQITLAIVATITTCVAIWVLAIGIKWVLRLARGTNQ